MWRQFTEKFEQYGRKVKTQVQNLESQMAKKVTYKNVLQSNGINKFVNKNLRDPENQKISLQLICTK